MQQSASISEMASEVSGTWENTQFELHQRLTKAAIAYHAVLESGASYDKTMAAAQELEDAADEWANRQAMPTFAQWYEVNEKTATMESAFSAGSREWRKECQKLVRDNKDLQRKLNEELISPNDIRQMKALAFKMGADAFRRRIEDWLNDTFEYENSVTTVHRVRETLIATTAEVSRVI